MQGRGGNLTALADRTVDGVLALGCPDPTAATSAASFIAKGIPGKFTQVPGSVSYPSGEIDLLYKFQTTTGGPPIKATVNLLPSVNGYCVTAVVLNAIFRG